MRTAAASPSKYISKTMKGLTFVIISSAVVGFLLVAGVRIVTGQEENIALPLTIISSIIQIGTSCLDLFCLFIFGRHVYKSKKTLHRAKSDTDIVAIWCAACCFTIVVLGVFSVVTAHWVTKYTEATATVVNLPAIYFGVTGFLNYVLTALLFGMKISLYRFQQGKGKSLALKASTNGSTLKSTRAEDSPGLSLPTKNSQTQLQSEVSRVDDPTASSVEAFESQQNFEGDAIKRVKSLEHRIEGNPLEHGSNV